MSLVGKPAPDFELEGYFDGEFKKYKLSNNDGKWTVLLFYPLDFTFVCPTEVLGFSKAAGDFEKHNTRVFGLSVDSKFVHKAWVDAKSEDGGLGGSLSYPLLADLNKEVARDYGVLLDDAGVALRGLFLIDPNGTVMHSTINHLSVGRSVKEVLRLVKAFQYVETHGDEVCPIDWDEGADSMKANTEGMHDYLVKHSA